MRNDSYLMDTYLPPANVSAGKLLLYLKTDKTKAYTVMST